VAKTGGEGEVVLEAAGWASSLAVDVDAVYLAVDDGTLLRVEK
jgi:hypothetical protein